MNKYIVKELEGFGVPVYYLYLRQESCKRLINVDSPIIGDYNKYFLSMPPIVFRMKFIKQDRLNKNVFNFQGSYISGFY